MDQFFVVGGKRPSVLMVDHHTTDQDVGSTYTFDDRQLGAAAPSRLLALAFAAFHSGANPNVVNAVSIGGVSAAKITGNAGTGSSSLHIWAAAVPTGTTGTVTIQRAGSMIDCSWVLWALYDIKSQTPVAAVTDFATGHPKVGGVQVAGNGVAVGFGYVFSNAAMTWAGLTEDADAAAASSAHRYSGASASRLSAANPHVVTLSNTAEIDASLLLASWR